MREQIERWRKIRYFHEQRRLSSLVTFW